MTSSVFDFGLGTLDFGLSCLQSLLPHLEELDELAFVRLARIGLDDVYAGCSEHLELGFAALGLERAECAPRARVGGVH